MDHPNRCVSLPAFCVQVELTTPLRATGIIISFSQLLGMILRRLREPKVIAEVVGGIMLGPTLFGMIPGMSCAA